MAHVVFHSEQPILAKGFAAVISGVSDLTLVGVSTDALRLPDLVRLTEAALLVVDWSSQMTLATLAAIRAQSPACHVILWVHSITPELARQMLGIGIHGVLCKTASLEITIQCLLRVAAGEHWYERAITESVLETQSYRLTRRESELVNLVSQGMKNKEIAHALNLSEATVKVYLSKLFRKIGVKDRYELALQGLKNIIDVRALSEKPPQPAASAPTILAKRVTAAAVS